MTAPPPPAPVSPRTVTVCLALASLVVVAALVAVTWWGTRPIAPPVESRPIPARTAGPAPITPVTLTAIPMHQRGPQALRTPEETR